MSVPENRSASGMYLVGVYVSTFFLCAVAFWGICYLTQTDQLAFGGISEFVAAMTMGRMWSTREKALPTSRDAWFISLWCASATIVVSGITGVVLIALDDPLRLYLKSISVVHLILLAALGIAIELLIIRLGVWSGTRAAMKSLSKQG